MALFGSVFFLGRCSWPVATMPQSPFRASSWMEPWPQLLALMLHQEGRPKSWTLVFEEGQRYTKDANFKEILSEGRVFARKILVSSQLARPFKELVPVYAAMPPPLRSRHTGEAGQG